MSTLAPTPRTTRITLGAASAGPFNVGLRLFEGEALRVYVGTTLRPDFTLTATFGDGYSDNGTILFASPLPVGSILTIDPVMIPRRDLDYLPGDPTITRRINVENGNQWAALADLQRDVDRSLKVYGAMGPVSLPPPGVTGPIGWAGESLVTFPVGFTNDPTTLSIRSFGAVGDGVTDDTLAVNAACTFAIASGMMLDGEGLTYRITSAIWLPVGKLRLRRATFDGGSIPLNGIFTTTIMSMLCPLPVLAATLTANAGQGALALSASGITGLAADDWVLVRSENIMAESEANDGRQARACELVQVRSIVGATINLWSPLQGAYTVAATARLEKVQRLGRVDFDAVSFIGCDRGFMIQEGWGSTYRGCVFRNQSTMCIYEERCYFTRADAWLFEGNAIAPEFTSAPYGINYAGSHNCDYGNVTAYRTRHAVTTGSTQTPKGRTVSRGNTLGDISSFESFSSPVDQHPGGGFIQVGKVKCTWAPNTSGGGAVQMQGAGGHIQSIENYGAGADAQITCDVLFDSHGFADPNFNPVVSVGALKSRNARRMVYLNNYSNRWGTGVPQQLGVQIAMADVISLEDALDLSCQSGTGYEVKVGAGRVFSKAGRCIYADNTVGGRCRVSGSGVRFKAEEGGIILALSQSVVASLIGGELDGELGATGSVASSARLDLTSVREYAVTLSASSGGVINRAGTPA